MFLLMFVQVMSNKFTGEPAGYGFVNFDSDQENIFIFKKNTKS